VYNNQEILMTEAKDNYRFFSIWYEQEHVHKFSSLIAHYCAFLLLLCLSSPVKLGGCQETFTVLMLLKTQRNKMSQKMLIC
jgi:hypothetical protein